jgi:hypothetical protein
MAKKEKIKFQEKIQGKQELKYHLIFCSIIFILTFTVYFNSLKNGFVWDDEITIVENSFIKDIKNVRNIFTQDYFELSKEGTYRPVGTLTYFIDYHLYELNPTGFHLTNILFHILNSILVYFLALTIFRKYSLSLFTSLLYSLHPIATEPVNAISFREDLLAMAFMLLSILTFIKSINSQAHKKVLSYLFSLIFFLFGIFSKETALVTPFIIILYQLTFGEKNISDHKLSTINYQLRQILYYPGFFLILLLYFYITRFVLYNPNPLEKKAYFGDSIIVTLLTMSKVFVYYLKNLILPIELSADYVIPLSHSIFEPMVLFSIAIIILLFITAIKLYKKSKEIFFGVIYLYITLLPVSNIIPIGHLMNDRYLYMPSLGFCLILSYILIKLLQYWNFNYISQKRINKLCAFVPMLLCVFILIFYSFFTIKQNIIWQDEITLWENVLKKFPDSVSANNALGNIYARQGNDREALKYLNKAIELKPKFAAAYNNRGIVYAKKGLNDLAIKDFKKSADLGFEFARKNLKKFFNIDY